MESQICPRMECVVGPGKQRVGVETWLNLKLEGLGGRCQVTLDEPANLSQLLFLHL